VNKVWIRSLVTGQIRELEGTDGAFAPFWSPDARHIAYFDRAENQLKRIPAAGGTSDILAATESEPKGGDWSPDGRIVFTPGYRRGLFEMSAEGGEPRAVTALAAEGGETSHRWPRFLPDGRSLLFLVQTAEAGADDDRSRLEILDTKGVRHEILKVNSSAEYAPPGTLLFWRHGSVYAQYLDLDRWRLEAEPTPLVDGVGLTVNEWATFSVSREGALVYHLAAALPWRLEWRDRAGRLLSVATDEGDFEDPVLSPDGSRVAYVAGKITVWILDLTRGVHTRLTFAESDHWSPTWGPGGSWLAYAADKQEGVGGTIVRRRSSGLGDQEVLYVSDKNIKDIAWSPDGRWIAFGESGDILLLDVETLETRVKIASPGSDLYPAFSPDGRWMAYTSDESGRYEVYLVPVLDDSGKWQISSRGGLEPRWNRAGDEILFRGLDFELHATKVNFAGGEIAFGPPTPLFGVPGAQPGLSFGIDPDGRILVRVQPSRGKADSFRFVQNWPALLVKPDR
jgi:Tol biopolymer transport system component